MTREILFRGKRLDSGEWVEGNLFILKQYQSDIDHYYILPTNTVCLFCDIFYYAVEVDPSTVGQYTGLTANGKKIFEGDIVKYKNTDGIKFNGVALTVIGKVVYNEKNASFAISGKDKIGAKHYDYFPIKNIEVIGNIHDNPELLEE